MGRCRLFGGRKSTLRHCHIEVSCQLPDNLTVKNQNLIPADRILVVMPNWLGDGVMATPLLRALRALYPAAQIGALCKPLIEPALTGLSSINFCQTYPTREKGGKRVMDSAATVRWIRQQEFDLAILLPNSFRSAWLVWRGGVKKRLGYAREGRSLLLTHKLKPIYRFPRQREADRAKAKAIREFGGGRLSVGSAYQPIPTINYYLGLLMMLGAEEATIGYATWHMELGITAEERQLAHDALYALQILPGEDYAVLVPGANFGSSKCWPPEHFAAVARALADPDGQYRMKVVLASSPAERPIIDAILKHAAMPERIVALANLNEGKGVALHALKEIVRGCKLMVCNDTGPRHFAAAFSVPLVTLFGPTDPIWAETYCEREKQVAISVPCGPCQLKKCPIDHRCMKGITPEMVMENVAQVVHPR